MSHSILFVCSSAPHGCSGAREGLDAALASSALSEDIGVLFVGDGVWQLKKGQEPKATLQRHLLPTFGLLDLYDVERRYVCAESLSERHLTLGDLAIEVEAVTISQQQVILSDSKALLRF